MLEISSQKGSSLIGVIFALGILGLVVSIVSKSQTNLLSSRSIVKHSQAYRDIESALVHTISKNIRSRVVNGSCGGGFSNLIGQTYMPIGSGGQAALRFVSSLDTSSWPANTPREHKMIAEQNCRQPYANSSGKMYFCIELNTSQDLSRGDSFFNFDYAFAEVAVVLTDAHTNQMVGCNAFAEAPATTIPNIYYSLYYSRPLLSENRFYNQYGMALGID